MAAVSMASRVASSSSRAKPSHETHTCTKRKREDDRAGADGLQRQGGKEGEREGWEVRRTLQRRKKPNGASRKGAAATYPLTAVRLKDSPGRLEPG
eukprot:6172156-Pleurochrysis_carterae.AAC.3